MSEGKRTPGPYWREMRTIYRGRPYTISSSHEVAEVVPEADLSEVDEYVDLLNKGTHFNGMLKAATEAQADYAAAASSARTSAAAARDHAERMRHQERLAQLENKAERFAQVIAGAEPTNEADPTEPDIVTALRVFLRYCDTTGSRRRPQKLRLSPAAYGQLREESSRLLLWDSDSKVEMFELIPIEVDGSVPEDQKFVGDM